MNTTVHYWCLIPLIAIFMAWRPKVIAALFFLGNIKTGRFGLSFGD